ncbi:MAG: hypothetical protein ABFD14_03345 [Anaerolineaceae bacterium]
MKLFDPTISQVSKIYETLRDNPKFKPNRKYCEKLWQAFAPFADKNFPHEFALQTDARFFEMYLANVLLDWGFCLCMRGKMEGPDLKVIDGNKVIWIEAVVATSGNGSDAVPTMEEHNRFKPVPEESIILRFTNAINTKRDKYYRYIKKSIVERNDVCLIALNGGSIEMEKFVPSPLPTILKAVYPIGNDVVGIDKNTMKVVYEHYDVCEKIEKKNGAIVKTTSFMDDKSFNRISGILYTNANLWENFSDNMQGLICIHNKMATIPLQHGWIKKGIEYSVKENQIQIKKY